MRRAAAALAAIAFFLAGAGPALAQDQETILIEIFLTRYGPEGEVVFVREIPIEPALVGATCTGTARTENNSSVHPNNDFLLTSAGVTAVIPDFERVAGGVSSMTTTLVLGETITVSIRIGPDGVTSEGLLVTLSCTASQPPATTTTTTTTLPPEPPATTTTTTQPPPPASTTTEPPPTGGIAAGGGFSAGTVEPALPWIGGGALALAAALAILAAGRRSTLRDRPGGTGVGANPVPK